MGWYGGNAGPSNTVKIAMVSISGVLAFGVAVVALAFVEGANVPQAIETLGGLGQSLVTLGTAATASKAGRDAVKSYASRPVEDG